MPARNEEPVLTRALSALTTQVDDACRAVPHEEYEVIVLLNNCTDSSASVVRRFAETHQTSRIHAVTISLPPPRANIGHVRRLLMDEACRRLTMASVPDGAILSTDADTVVSPPWLHRNCQLIEAGFDAVGGRILVSQHKRQLLPPDIERCYLLDVAYNILRTRLESRLAFADRPVAPPP